MTQATISDCELFWNVHVPRLLSGGRDTKIPDLRGEANFQLVGSGGGDWTIRAEDGVIAWVRPGSSPDATITVRLQVGEFLAIATGDVDHRASFFAGRIEVAGDVELMLWVANLIPILRDRFPFRADDYRNENS